MSRGLQMLVEEGEHSSCVHAVRSVGSREIAIFYRKSDENCVSYPYDEQKTWKTAFRTPKMSRKREKPAVVGRRNAKNDKNCLSSADDRGKTQKTALRRPTKWKIQQKLPVVGRRNAESPVFCPSLVSETQNHPISAFPPAKQSHKPCAFNEDRVSVIIA